MILIIWEQIINKFEEIKGLINLKKFQNERKRKIKNSSTTKLPQEYPMNILEEELHPETQYLKITKIIDRGEDAKSFVFVPDESKGTTKLTYFQAGQYISLKLHIGKSYCTRAYAISSTPKQALSGEYMITIKLVKNGFVTPYIWKNWKVGTEVAASGPAGQLFYEPLRDKKTIIAIAGGSGITPFYSMAGAIADGTIDANLTILYGSRTHNHILLGDELKKITDKTNKVKIVNVLSDEDFAGYEHGFINQEIIEKNAPKNKDYTIYMSGPAAMIHFVSQEIKKIGLRRGQVRQEMSGTVNPYLFKNYPEKAKDKIFKMTVKTRDQIQIIPARSDESLLVAMERAGIVAPSSCRVGVCRSRVVDGKVFIPFPGRRAADSEYNYVNTCVTFPISDAGP